jgi:tetratricopeptide (TPR) repeat protein
VNVYGDSYGAKLFPILKQGIALAKECNSEGAEIMGYLNILFFQFMTAGKINPSEFESMPSIEQMTERLYHNPDWRDRGLALIGYFAWFRGEFEKGFGLMFEILRRCEGKENMDHAWTCFALGVFYFDTNDLENSWKYYSRSHDVFRKIDLKYGIARAATGMASVAIAKKDPVTALPLLESAIKIYRDMGQISGLSRALNDMGLLEKTEKNYDTAIRHLEESIQLRNAMNHVQGLITSYTELGETYFEKQEYEKALAYQKIALEYAIHVTAKQKRSRLHKSLSDTYKKLGDIHLALEHFESFFAVRSQIMSDEAANNIKKVQTKYEREKSEKEAEMEREKNLELTKAYDIIEQKNKDITDSIRYAKRIQLSLLPTEKLIHRTLSRLNKSGSKK